MGRGLSEQQKTALRILYDAGGELSKYAAYARLTAELYPNVFMLTKQGRLRRIGEWVYQGHASREAWRRESRVKTMRNAPYRTLSRIHERALIEGDRYVKLTEEGRILAEALTKIDDNRNDN